MRLGLGVGLKTSKSRSWITQYKPVLLADMTSEDGFTLTNAAFSDEQAESGTRSIKMNIPAGGTSTVRYTFPEAIDMRVNSIRFALKAINANVAALSIAYLRFGCIRKDGVVTVLSYSSDCPINSFRPIGDWVYENAGYSLSDLSTNLLNVWANILYMEMSFTAEATNAVTLYLDSIIRQPQPKTPAIILVSADDGYLTYGTIAADAADANDVKLSVAVTKNFTVAGQHTISGSLRPVMTFEQLAAFSARGHEVCNHSLTHPNIQTIGAEQTYDEMVGWANELIALGYNPTSARVWIPPNGGVSDVSAGIIKQYMTAQRNPRLFNDGGGMPTLGNDLNNLMSSIYEAKTVEQINEIFGRASRVSGVMILYGHDVHTEAEAPHGYSIHIDAFTRICENIKEKKLISINYKDLINLKSLKITSAFDHETQKNYALADKETFEAENIYLPSGMLVRYDMKGIVGTNLPDLSGNNHHGVLTNITSLASPDRISKPTTGSFVNLPVASFIGDAECTIITAVRLAGLPASPYYQGFWFESRTGNNNIRLALEIGFQGTIRFRAITSLGTLNAVATPTVFPLNKWVFLCGRRDKTTTAGNTKFKLFAAFETGLRLENDTANFVNPLIDDNVPNKIQLFDSATVTGLNNEIGDVLVYKKLLTDAEVMAAIRYLARQKEYGFDNVFI